MKSRALILGFVLCACGSGSNSSGAAAPDTSSSDVVKPEVPFLVIQPESYVLATAAQGLKAKIGHEVNVDVDADLMKLHADQLPYVLADAFETVSRGIDRARQGQPVIAARAILILGSLKFELDEKTRESYARFDPVTGVLVIRVASDTMSLTTDAAIANALMAAEQP